MQRIAIAFVLGIAALSAEAGVTIVDNNVTHYASGQFAAPASVGQESAYLYCELWGSIMYCGASDGLGNYAGCSTSDPNFKQLFPMIRKTTTMTFFWDANSACTRVDVSNSGLAHIGLPVPGAIKSPTPVFISADQKYAYGTLSPTAATAANELIGCAVHSDGVVSCAARDHNGLFASCVTSRDSTMQTLADQILATTAINETSFVYFIWDNTVSGANTCTFIATVNASYQLP